VVILEFPYSREHGTSSLLYIMIDITSLTSCILYEKEGDIREPGRCRYRDLSRAKLELDGRKLFPT